LDEALALPTDQTARTALRTQQLVAYETGAANVADPLGGSWLVESLTDRLEQEAEEYFRRIDEYGGVIPAIEAGFFQKEIADAAFQFQQECERKERLQVGVNAFTEGNEEDPVEILRISSALETAQVERVRAVRSGRDAARASNALATLGRAARSPRENLMPHILEAVKAYCTEGEIMQALIDVFGTYTERAVI
ncbi:MAG: methylmalonyl-CoA mutase, partial [Candidatus Dormibacteraeota bacterium]|nr:methylmalonyl-CoA mutase [Candidatus Dormibacteraeota bacterium]